MTNNLPKYLTVSTDISFDLHAEISRLDPDKIAILVDENSKRECLSLLNLDAQVIEIRSGEEHKTLQTCEDIWQQLTKWSFSRKSLLINLGGGVIGDMGGFAASTYKRGMHFINIPTTLLSQVDASIGGKLGVDFRGLKNHIGLFRDPVAVLVHSKFLKTLPPRELKSGFAEVIKHVLIKSPEHWKRLTSTPFEKLDWNALIPQSIAIKQEVVSADPYETGLRKILNYGHTLGHAIESHFLKTERKLLHGEAIAAGMMLENELSVRLGFLSETESEEINSFIQSVYTKKITIPSFEELNETLKQDKKNKESKLSFSLLKKIGKCKYDVHIEANLLRELLK